MFYDLYIFDVDGTLAERDGTRLLPGVAEWFAANQAAVALATNQGGVGLRYWMESAGFGNPENYPTDTQVLWRLRGLCDQLRLPYTAINVCFAYQSKAGNWSPTPSRVENEAWWDPDCRKPAAGMLLDAMAYVEADRAVMLGDS